VPVIICVCAFDIAVCCIWLCSPTTAYVPLPIMEARRHRSSQGRICVLDHLHGVFCTTYIITAGNAYVPPSATSFLMLTLFAPFTLQACGREGRVITAEPCPELHAACLENLNSNAARCQAKGQQVQEAACNVYGM
jgi:hypothetical protein